MYWGVYLSLIIYIAIVITTFLIARRGFITHE